MRQWPGKPGEDSGNALVEFVFLFCTALVLAIIASSRVELEIRSRSAAFAIANEVLRTWQLTSDHQAVGDAARYTAETFGVSASNLKFSLEDQCEAGGWQSATAKVNEVIEVAHGFC